MASTKRVGHNRVLLNHDPTCHAEMEAIRDACKNLGTHDLSGCDIYVTAEPCPMCLSACLWANIRHVVRGCTREGSENIGFRDKIFYDCLDRLFATFRRSNLKLPDSKGEGKSALAFKTLRRAKEKLTRMCI